MKKIIFTAIATAAFVASSVSTASTLSEYYSAQHAATPSVLDNKKLMHPPTDITVINATTSYFYAVVPNSPVNVLINPGYNNHIYNNDPTQIATFLVLQDPYRITFYNANVCRLAIVTVYGSPGHYRINTDSDLCY